MELAKLALLLIAVMSGGMLAVSILAAIRPPRFLRGRWPWCD